MKTSIVQLLKGDRRSLIKSGYLSYCENYTINHAYSTAKLLDKSKPWAVINILWAYLKCICRIITNRTINPDLLKKRLADDIRNLFAINQDKAKQFVSENEFFLN